MISHEKYVAGWLDSSIGDFLEVFPRTFDSMKYALITCLDSNTEPASLLETSPALHAIKKDARPIGPGILLPTRLLARVELADQIFFGFDEIWFFPDEISEPKPGGVSLVGPAKVDQAKLNKASEWMSDNSCTLAMGDGCGLNFIIKARGLVMHVLGHSLDQPRSNAVHFSRTTADAAR